MTQNVKLRHKLIYCMALKFPGLADCVSIKKIDNGFVKVK